MCLGAVDSMYWVRILPAAAWLSDAKISSYRRACHRRSSLLYQIRLSRAIAADTDTNEWLHQGSTRGLPWVARARCNNVTQAGLLFSPQNINCSGPDNALSKVAPETTMGDNRKLSASSVRPPNTENTLRRIEERSLFWGSAIVVRSSCKRKLITAFIAAKKNCRVLIRAIDFRPWEVAMHKADVK